MIRSNSFNSAAKWPPRAVAALFLCAGVLARAAIVGPYTPDEVTLHLWHLDEAGAPALDSASGGTNLTSLANGATLGKPSYSGLGAALSTYDGGPNGTNAANKDAALSALPLVNGSGDNVALSCADSVTGAFTYEAVVRVDFDPARNFGPVTAGGNGRSTQMMLLSAEDEANEGRLFQFRIDPIGTFTNSRPLLEFININQAVSIQNISVPIPTNGPDSIVSNGWYHVAMAYNGNAGAPDNLKFYWTLMDPSRTNANLIGSGSMTLDLPAGVAPDFTIGNTGRGAANANFVGLIDEVRMSSVARPPSGMMFITAATFTAATYLDCLVDFERYAESVWHDANGTGRPPDSGYFGDGNSTGNGGIRGSCGVALADAVLVHSLPADPKKAARLARIQKAINYAANTHVSGTNTCIDGKKWGHDWQTSLWAGSMGLTCLLVQNDLPASTIQACQRAIADEATYRAGVPPASGYVGDTKAEENAWNGNVVALAAAWLDTNTNAALWLDAAKKYLVNTYTVANTNGDPLASWITTTTLYPSYALENHGFYHPLYQMVSGMSLGDSLLMARLANTNIAAQLQPFAEHNVLNVWQHLSRVVLDSGEFAFPSGLDWAMHTFQQNSYYAWLATGFNDPLARRADAQLVQLLRYRQIVNGDGTFLDSTEANAFYMEAVIARRSAIAWLHHAYAPYTNGPTAAPGNSVEHSTDIKLITQHSPWGFTSISYGPKIMALVEPAAASVPTNAFVTTPRLPGIIGLGALGNPTAAQLVNFATNANGFDAELTLQHGSQGTTEVYVKSTGETIAIVEVPCPVAGGLATAAGSFSVDIENDPLTGGSRLLEWTGGPGTVTNRTGAVRNITNHWVCVAGRYGLAAGPAGYFKYQGASSYNRLGAAEDTLQFMPQNPLGARYAVWFPGKSAAQTGAGTGDISWSLSSSNAVLTFPGLGGVSQQIVAALPVPQPYPGYFVSPAAITASSWTTGYPPTNAVDGNADTFWVSAGGSPGQGPTTNHPEWLQVSFPRLVAVSEFQVSPRTYNGGYGPKAIQMLLNGLLVYEGTLAPTAALDVLLPQPVYATNSQLLITSAYDPLYPTNSRNVQVVELSFFERALPGTFADWSLHQFTDLQLADPAIGGALADPDGDGRFNLAEFVVDGNPLAGDAPLAALQTLASPPGTFGFTFRERSALGDVQRRFEQSTDLVNWSEVTPVQLAILTNWGVACVRHAVLPAPAGGAFFRLKFVLPSGP